MLVVCAALFCAVFFFKQNTSYEMRISDWSSDVCSSDLMKVAPAFAAQRLEMRCGPFIGRDIAGKAFPYAGTQDFHRHLPAIGRDGAVDLRDRGRANGQIGQASCLERVCQYVSIPGVAVYRKKNQDQKTLHTHSTK